MTDVSSTIRVRIGKNREILIENLKKVPIIQVACEKTGIGRATYYRWRKDDEAFTRQIDEALQVGRSYINDLAESQLIKSIQERDLTAVFFWLKNNHTQYSNRLELTAKVTNEPVKLTEQQEALVKKALELASLAPTTEVSETTNYE